MKIQCKRENLLSGLNVVGRMVKTRATLPVLSNILIASDKGRLKLVSTDLEAAIVHWIGAKIDEEGAITIPARTLIDYVTSTSDDTIELASQGADISISSSHYHSTIKGLNAEEFPIIPRVESSNPIKVAAKVLKNAILSVAPAAALDETRPVLAGVLIKQKGADIYVVATDSYRLAEQKIEIGKSDKALEIIIPQRTAAELARILPLNDTEVGLFVGENQAEFRFGEIEFQSRQIEGSFPDYEQIIPKDFVYEIEASKSEMEEAIKTASIFSRDSGNNIKLSGAANEMVITSVSSQIGDAEARLKVVSKGTPLNISFNARYILDALAAIGGEQVKVSFAGELNPGLITGPDNHGYRYIIMPLRNE